jgi:hypothetical protein
MRRTADEIDRAIAQGRIGLVDREDQFERDIEPLSLEEAEFDRGLRWEIRVGDHVRHGELHGDLLGDSLGISSLCGKVGMLRGEACRKLRSQRVAARVGRVCRAMIAASSLTTRYPPRR